MLHFVFESTLLDTADKHKKALKLVMDIAGPRDTMHPFALKMYGQIEELLMKKRKRVSEIDSISSEVTDLADDLDA